MHNQTHVKEYMNSVPRVSTDHRYLLRDLIIRFGENLQRFITFSRELHFIMIKKIGRVKIWKLPDSEGEIVCADNPNLTAKISTHARPLLYEEMYKKEYL